MKYLFSFKNTILFQCYMRSISLAKKFKISLNWPLIQTTFFLATHVRRLPDVLLSLCSFNVFERDFSVDFNLSRSIVVFSYSFFEIYFLVLDLIILIFKEFAFILLQIPRLIICFSFFYPFLSFSSAYSFFKASFELLIITRFRC